MPDNENNLNNEPVDEETPVTEDVPVATADGTFKKKGYCNGCFSVLTWEDPAVEVTVFGNRVVYCPECGAPVNVADAIVEEEA